VLSKFVVEEGLVEVLPEIKIDNVTVVQNSAPGGAELSVKIRYQLETDMDVVMVAKWFEKYLKVRIIRVDNESLHVDKLFTTALWALGWS
jgi:hypothetical protein